MKKLLAIYLCLGIVGWGSLGFAQEHEANDVYHFVFKMEESIKIEDTSVAKEKLFEYLRNKSDSLGVERVRIRRSEQDLVLMTYETSLVSEEIVTAIQSELPIPWTMEAFFKCDFAHKGEF